MKYRSNRLGSTTSQLLIKDASMLKMAEIREDLKKANRRRTTIKLYGYKVKDVPTIKDLHEIDDFLQQLKLWQADRSTQAANGQSRFVPTDRPRIINILYDLGYELVSPLYVLPTVVSSYNDRGRRKEQTAKQQIQLFALKKDTVPGHPHLRYAVYIQDCWDGETAFTLSCAIVHDQHFQIRNSRQIIWKEYIRLSHMKPHVPDEIYDLIETKIQCFESMWEEINKHVKNNTLHQNVEWDNVMEDSLHLRTNELLYNPLIPLGRYGFKHFDPFGNLYVLWAFASGSFRIGDSKAKKYTPTATKEVLQAFDNQYLQDIVYVYFPAKTGVNP